MAPSPRLQGVAVVGLSAAALTAAMHWCWFGRLPALAQQLLPDLPATGSSTAIRSTSSPALRGLAASVHLAFITEAARPYINYEFGV